MIERITIQNFKSIADVTVDLSPVTVLVGRSGTGKSNFLSAIRFVRDFLLAEQHAVKVVGDWDSVVPAGREATPLVIRMQIRLPDYDSYFDYAMSFGFPHGGRAQVPMAESLSYGSQSIFAWVGGNKKNSGWTEKPNIANPPPIKGFMIGSLPTVTEAVLVYTALSTGIAWHDFPAAVFTESSHASKQTIFSHGAAAAFNGLQDDGRNYLNVYQRLTQDLRDQHSRRLLIKRLRQLNPSVNSMELDSIQRPSKMIVGHLMESKAVPLELQQESDGFRRFFAALLAIYQTPPRQTILFEEPENGIHPGALEILAEEFNAAPSEGRGQIIMTTQSPRLLDHFSEESIRVVELDPSKQRTRIGPLDSDQRAAIREHLLSPGEILAVDPARMAPASHDTEAQGA